MYFFPWECERSLPQINFLGPGCHFDNHAHASNWQNRQWLVEYKRIQVLYSNSCKSELDWPFLVSCCHKFNPKPREVFGILRWIQVSAKMQIWRRPLLLGPIHYQVQRSLRWTLHKFLLHEINYLRNGIPGGSHSSMSTVHASKNGNSSKPIIL